MHYLHLPLLDLLDVEPCNAKVVFSADRHIPLRKFETFSKGHALEGFNDLRRVGLSLPSTLLNGRLECKEGFPDRPVIGQNKILACANLFSIRINSDQIAKILIMPWCSTLPDGWDRR